MQQFFAVLSFLPSQLFRSHLTLLFPISDQLVERHGFRPLFSIQTRTGRITVTETNMGWIIYLCLRLLLKRIDSGIGKF